MIDWEQQFPIASINRADLTEFGLSEEQISTIFTDKVMVDITDLMARSYIGNNYFWKDFRIAIRSVTGLVVEEAAIVTLAKEREGGSTPSS